MKRQKTAKSVRPGDSSSPGHVARRKPKQRRLSRILDAPVPENLHPVVKFFFLEVRRRTIPIDQLAITSGLSRQQIYTMWDGTMPKLSLIERGLNRLGYKLVIEDMQL